MMSKGVISSEELRQQLGESLPGTFQISLFCHSGTFIRISAITADDKSTFQPGLTEEKYSNRQGG
ncbi:MAG: hypothetical protein F6J96_19990 [Symploca sp. SIO1C2]|nr:hypothetical protein [Symploca sp. SIO1C2]